MTKEGLCFDHGSVSGWRIRETTESDGFLGYISLDGTAKRRIPTMVALPTVLAGAQMELLNEITLIQSGYFPLQNDNSNRIRI